MSGDRNQLVIDDRDGRARFSVRVSPRASREAILGVHDGALKIALTAPPVEGAANAALIAMLARALGVSKSAVVIVRGQSAKTKRVEIAGVGADRVRALLG